MLAKEMKKIPIIIIILVMIFSLAACKEEQQEKQPKQEEEKKVVDSDDPLLILINKDNSVAKDYIPADMISVTYYWKDSQPAYRVMVREAAEAFDSLATDAKAAGMSIECTTAYRDYEFQEMLYKNYVAQHGELRANRFSAKPGYSEHQSGLAVDVSNSEMNYVLMEEFEKTESGKWLAKNAHKYGFIIRYPKDGEDKTGYDYEPWHLRYVGKDVAEYIYKKGITLEEYLGE